MKLLDQVKNANNKYAWPSLLFSVCMGMVTLIHHLHSAIFLHPDSGAMHIVYNEFVLIPATIISMFVFLKNNNKIAFWIYIIIAVLGFIFLGLFEGGWNHTAKLIAYLRIDSLFPQIGDILPKDNWHYWFYELSGVLTFMVTMIASYYTLRFFNSERNA